LVRSLIAIGLLAVLATMALILVSQRRNAALLQELADFDPLTGLPNRRQLDRTMNAALRAAAAEGAPLMLVMVDLDNFKTVNDVHGHHIGDLVLIEVARRFQKQLRSSDSVSLPGEAALGAAASIGRLGGDEFLIVLPGVASDEAAGAITERLLSALAVPMLLDGRTIQTRASMGIAFYPEHGETATQLMRCADQAMYEAKRAEDSAVVLFQREVNPDAMRRIRLTRDLREALANEQFELHYQPIVNLSRERVDSVEALLRWRHPEFGVVSPNEFVPLLERSGLIVAVGLWALRKACEQLVAWRNTGAPIESVAVNVSVVQLSHSDFSQDALDVVDRTGIERSRVTVEVTESVLMENPDRSIGQLSALRAAGIRISMDDFGTGYSSLSYLRRLPVHAMKIDRSLLIDAISPGGRAILASMVRLSAELGLDCVVEGVETLEQFHLLRDLGCQRLQGYLFARPLPADEAEAAARRIHLQQFGIHAGPPLGTEQDLPHPLLGLAPASVH
jgi:diguanylate cyclase (GGDEF)-like protein